MLATASGYAQTSEQPLTHRRDWWWVFPLFTLVVYSAFIIYATYRVLEPAIALWQTTGAFDFVPTAEFATVKAYNDYYYIADNGNYHYLSPFGTPDLTFLVPSALHAVPFLGAVVRSPAFVILPFPALFRFTCYYYRKSYYRAFTARPYACGVPAAVPGGSYKGERGLLVVQNLHRYLLYAAIVITLFLAYDAIRSVITPHGFYFGFGSALMLVNVALLMLYTFGCHSFRHLVGGKLDIFSCDPLAKWRYGWWSKVTMLNERHAMWAWLSLFSVALTDVYIRWLIANPDVTHLFGLVPV